MRMKKKPFRAFNTATAVKKENERFGGLFFFLFFLRGKLGEGAAKSCAVFFENIKKHPLVYPGL
jgi:hypothetical protein